VRAERKQLLRFAPLVDAFERLARSVDPGQLQGHLVLLREAFGRDGGARAVEELRSLLERALGDGVELRARALRDGTTGVLVLVPSGLALQLERLLAQTRIEEVRLPASYGDGFLAALPRLRARRGELVRELRGINAELQRLGGVHAPTLLRTRDALHDGLSALAALPLLGHTQRAAVLEGWVPASALPRLQATLQRRLGGRVAVEEILSEPWERADAPVELRNPRLFRPFETLVRQLPLPRYGSLDPTPFVGVFFPMFFGVMLGDLGYGSLLALVALLLARGAGAGTLRHSLARIAGACAAFSLVFGALYGELFGDLGRRLGLRPLWFDRGEAIVPFLVLAVSLGLLHLLLGLFVAAFRALRSDRRRAAGRGLEGTMLLLAAAGLLAAVGVLPRALFAPVAIAALIAFPLLVAVEGIVAPVELLSTLGHVLSYARIMAIGTASVMLAVVANRMVGTLGSALVGTLFALIFHAVNFALGLFSPAVHALRLHYVEFFGTCYSPGGVRYQPLAHWHGTAGTPGDPSAGRIVAPGAAAAS
jgi:V/A-type H+-transporting ATPase subunit I